MPEGSLLIIALFLGYFVIHSLTASLWMKELVARHWPRVMPYYRLLFNTLALLLFVPLALITWFYPGEPLWQWQGMAFYLANGLALLAFITLFYSFRLYDMQEFLGLRQWRGKVRAIEDLEHFRISVLHRFVRHPWYFLLLVLLWTRDISTTQLLSYTLLTLYLVIGSRLEERKLIAYHGEVYAAYRKRVAGLIPLPWKYLTRQQADELLRSYRHK